MHNLLLVLNICYFYTVISQFVKYNQVNIQSFISMYLDHIIIIYHLMDNIILVMYILLYNLLAF
jgi:hypothetical protein